MPSSTGFSASIPGRALERGSYESPGSRRASFNGSHLCRQLRDGHRLSIDDLNSFPTLHLKLANLEASKRPGP
jgi:hypothetical protein